MNKRIEILLHLAIWLVMFLSPMMFMNHGRGVTIVQFLMASIVTFAFMLVFYMNYLWLAPRYFDDKHHRYYFIINIIFIVTIGITLHLWMEHIHNLYDSYHPIPNKWNTLGFILRDIFNLVVTAAIATLIRLASRWQKAEQARHDAEAARIEAELKTLRWQINPHFLLNTLNNIYALTAFDTPKAQESIQELSKMLRHILYDNEQPTVPLSEEVEFMENYIKLMRIRLPQSVEVEAQFSIHNSQIRITPMIFISLIENAFKHGVSPTQSSFIHVNMTADTQKVIFDITNSYHPKDRQDRSGHGIGLKQVQQRLDLVYPNCYSWERGVSDDGKTYHSRITLFLTINH